MPKSQMFCFLSLACSVTTVYAGPIRLNSLGFLPDHPKLATVAVPCTNFTLIRQSDGKSVFAARASGPQYDEASDEQLYTCDFSGCTNAGLFTLDIPGVGRSEAFRIGPEIYDDAYRTAMRAFYLWRCGTAVSASRDGHTFAHAICHTNDAWMDLVNRGQHVQRDSMGGWHDAGDYNKYVVNAGVTVGVLLRAWEDFGPRLVRLPLGLPEAGGRMPEFLAELRWELNWLLTMQADNGSVYHKVSTKAFGGFLPPEQENAPRYFAPWSSSATANFTAIMAMAARNFAPFDPEFSARCLAAAKRSQVFLLAHPENHPADLGEFSTGPYQTDDTEPRLWAAAELWETEGSSNELSECEYRIRAVQARVDARWDYGNVKNLGELTYLFSKRSGRDTNLVEKLQTNLVASAAAILRDRDASGYARPLGSAFFWGANGTVARQSVVLEAAFRVTGDNHYRTAELDALAYLFGRNCFGRSFVTGLGWDPPLHPHDRRLGGDPQSVAWPGYLVGGPHPRPEDWHDETGDFRTNEIAVNWNAALVYLLAAFVQGPVSD